MAEHVRSTPGALAERRKARIEREYAELRAVDPELFRECVRSAEALVLNNRAARDLDNSERVKLAAEIEQALVSIATRARHG